MFIYILIKLFYLVQRWIISVTFLFLVQCDSVMLVCILKGKARSPWKLDRIIQEILHIARNLHIFLFIFSRRLIRWHTFQLALLVLLLLLITFIPCRISLLMLGVYVAQIVLVLLIFVILYSLLFFYIFSLVYEVDLSPLFFGLFLCTVPSLLQFRFIF